jgi:hypothetical protein
VQTTAHRSGGHPQCLQCPVAPLEKAAAQHLAPEPVMSLSACVSWTFIYCKAFCIC